MEKKFLIFLVAVVVLSMLMGFLSSPAGTLFKHIAPRDQYTETVEEMIDEVVRDVGKVRMLDAPGSVDVKIVTVEWVKENWGPQNSGEEVDSLRLEEEIYRALYLIPEDFSLLELKREQSGAIMAASAGGTIYIVREYFNPYEEVEAKDILAHETVHVLQGINFEIHDPGEFDAKQAKSALVEGDAGLATEKYLTYKFNMTMGRQFLPPSGNGSLCDREALWELWTFPYAYGYTFVEALYDEEGWDGVNAAYDNMPISTEQIMHPQKYLAGEGVADIELESPPKWELKRSDRMGEHFVMIMLGRHLPVDEAKIASEGWAGDKFEYYKMDSEYFFMWKTVWDSSKDKDEFSAAFRELMKSLEGDELSPNYWHTYYGYVTVKADKLGVTITGSSDPAVLG